MASSSSNRPSSLMARFTIEEDEDDDDNDNRPILTTRKRPRRSQPPPPPPPPPQPSQSHTVHEEEDDDDDEDLIPVEEVEEFESDDDDDDDENGSDEYDEDESSEDDDVTVSPAVNRRNCVELSAVVGNGNDELQVVLTDPDVLDCPICLDSLSTPVFQCENGHIACDSCCYKVNRKCPSCCMPIGYNRCRAIEKVIESIKLSCKNAQYGCTMNIMYNKKNEHEQVCPHAPCFCPYPLCPVSGSSKNLYLHFDNHHKAPNKSFTFNKTIVVSVPRNKKQTFLQEKKERVIFILNREEKEQGPAFNIDCVGPGSFKTSFEYQLTAKHSNSGATLSLNCVPEIYAKWSERTLTKNYLPAIGDFLRYDGVVLLDVCIKKKALAPV